ncbi:hypothetical protein A1O3_07802 [Capronia epimyces CBS 606.96]|uniref:Uncharacterized protein n=1 Tax=Capronia epimyces CBS 606.96 TaxID=1182542 RepID=W9XH27_9EURO|nr:uncharacterized protein A1O3_07802 [Capronia epimyces CBS 606.96]EXJ79523.1 hypothetical protein A1O3_07802 [Capronia epimyces CBS 606.96]
MSSQSQTFSPSDVAPYSPSYDQICTTPLTSTSKLISFAGLVGADPVTGYTAPTFPGQVELALKNLGKCLEAAGATSRDIVQVRQYIVGLRGHMGTEDAKARGELFMKFMGGHKPPNTLVGVEGLVTKEILYEIEVMAVVSR